MNRFSKVFGLLRSGNEGHLASEQIVEPMLQGADDATERVVFVVRFGFDEPIVFLESVHDRGVVTIAHPFTDRMVAETKHLSHQPNGHAASEYYRLLSRVTAQYRRRHVELGGHHVGDP